MTDDDGLVRRRINGWYIDEMLEMCEKNPSDDEVRAAGPYNLKMIHELFCVSPTQCPDEECFVWFSAEDSNFIYPAAIPAANQDDHPTLADVYFGWFSFEQFLAMKLAQSITTNPRHKNTLKELLGLYKRTADLQGLLDAFMATDSLLKYYCTMLNPEQRTQYIIIIELILFALMGDTMSGAGDNKHLAVCKKILDKHDRCFRDDWLFCKHIYATEKRALIEDGFHDAVEAEKAFHQCMERLSAKSVDGESSDIAETNCIRFFMMTRKLPVSSLADTQKLEYGEIFEALMEIAHHEYSTYNSYVSGLRLTGCKEDSCPVSEETKEMWERVHREVTVPRVVHDFHIPTKRKPISPPFAVRVLLSHYGISFCRLSSLFGKDACANAIKKCFSASVEQSVSFGEKINIRDVLDACAKGTADDVYYLGVIDMLSRAYAEAMQIELVGAPKPEDAGIESGIDAEQLEVSLSLAQENKKLREQIDQLNMELEVVKTDMPDIKSIVGEKAAAEIEAYKKEKDAQVSAKLQKKDERISRLENRAEEAMAATMRVMREAGVASGNDAPEGIAKYAETDQRLSEEDYEAIEEAMADQKVYIFGGHADWRKKMKKAFPYIPIIPTDSYLKYADALANADIIIVNAFHCSHKASNTVIDAAKKGNARLIYVERERNPTSVGQLLIKSLGISASKAR